MEVKLRKKKTVSYRKHVVSDGDCQQVASVLSAWSGPRTVLIPKTDQGYGFTLRHFIYYPPSLPQEQISAKEQDENAQQGPSYKRSRLSFCDPTDTIFVKNVRTYSPAYLAGLNTGDRIITVNDEPVSQKSYAQVIGLIQQSEGILKLQVLPKNEDKIQQPSLKHSDYRHSIAGNLEFDLDAPTRRSNSSDDLLDQRRARAHNEYLPYQNMDQPSKMKTSTSYTSGLSIYREPWTSSESKTDSFSDRRRDFETRSKENKELPPNKAYSFGLFYPTSDKTKSASDLTSAIPRRKDNVLHSNDSQENISKSNGSTKSQARVIPLEHRYSRDLTQDKSSHASSSSSSRHSYTDPSNQDNGYNDPPNQISSYTDSSNQIRSQNSQQKSEYHKSTRQYIPVVSAQPSLFQSAKMSASADSLDSSSSIYYPERSLRPRIYEQPNTGGGARTFIVKIGDRHYEGGMSQGHSASETAANSAKQVPSYGTAFALTRSPMSTSLEEGRKVTQKKIQYENGKNENTPVGAKQDRYKTEIKKITSHGKFNSVAARLQQFEKDGTLPSNSGVRVRRSSQDRCVSVPPESILQSSSPAQNYQESAPIRIYVSQGSVHSPTSPIVEIFPSHQKCNVESSPQEVTSQSVIHIKHSDDTDGACISRKQSSDDDSGHGKPVRKPSFLAAVNSSQQRYSGTRSSSDELTSSPEPPRPAMSPTWSSSLTPVSSVASFSAEPGILPISGSEVIASTPIKESMPTVVLRRKKSERVIPVSIGDGMAITNTPVKDQSSMVVLRRKSETSPEDEAIKLQRRTSYLMATANDRDSHKLSLDKSLSPSQSQTHIHVEITPQKPSMKKLKHFFGEKTPRIMEATERRQDPASPMQEVTKQGSLYFKNNVTDGKKASDRSWKLVWVELRGHALYLSKEKREPAVGHTFSFDDQPISIKSCIVDIAYDYTKKKNVFRLRTFNSSEYLFQADDNDSMLSWIQAIQSNNNPDADDKGQQSANLILRSRTQYEQGQPALSSHSSTSSLKTSPQVPPKPSKLSVRSRIKIPHSPSIKRKSKDEGKPKGGGLLKFKSFRKGNSSSASAKDTESNDMFGVPLETCIPSPNNDFVPMIVDLCTKIVEARGLEVTGVYRVPGNTAAVNMMQEELNKGIDNMNVDHEKWCDVNVISSLLKTFFRNLPDPLITSTLYQEFINANRIEDLEMRMLKLKRLIHELPEHHFETFKHLAEHLNTVASFGHINKMDARNLAIVFGPTLIKKKDDDMTSIVKDMSDQCRIVESIILHYDWFFSSWDRDSYVPLEEGREDDEAPTNPSVSKMSCDEDDNTVNPKDIVSSIVQAANQKMRKKSAPAIINDLNSSMTDGGFHERNIDLEIKRSKIRSQAELTSRSSPNLASMSAGSSENSRSQCSTENLPDRRLAMSHELIDSNDWEYIERNQTGPNVFAKVKHFSNDSLDQNEDFEPSHGMSSNFSVSQSTIDRLRIIEEEARALREKEEKRQRNFERRKIERQRQERTKKEIDPDFNIDNWTSLGANWHSTSDIFNKIARGETKDLSEKRHSDEKYRSSTSSITDKSDSSRKNSDSGGKYFVIQSVNSRSNSRDRLSQGSSESGAMPIKPSNSAERLLDLPKTVTPAKISKSGFQVRELKSKSAGREHTSEHRRSRRSLNRSDSTRRGSLDSLINIGRQYSRNDSDSEDGTDLLSDLTSTFDQKLQILVNPKYKLNGSATKLNSGEVLDKDSAHLRLPPQVPLSQAQCNKFGLCNSNDMLEKQYRDPSLHRSPKDAKIGIAYRFERSPLTNTAGQGDTLEQFNPDLSSVISPREEVRTSTVTVLPLSVYDRNRLGDIYKSKDFKHGSKGERTESSIPQSPLIQEDKSSVRSPILSYERSKSAPKGVDFNLNVTKSSVPKSNNTNEKVTTQKRKPKKRRHTVGGTDDLEHFKALMTVVQPRTSPKLTAWEQLRPAVKDMPEGSNRSLLSWLQNERLRGSTPDLSVMEDKSPKFY